MYPSFITTGKSILLEITLSVSILSLIGFFVLDLSIFQLGYWIIPLAIPFLTYTVYKSTQYSGSFDSEADYSPTKKELLNLSVLWLLCSGVLLYKTVISSYIVAVIPILLSSLYVYRLNIINRLYSVESLFYIDEYSRNSNEWAEAAATLTRSLNQREENNSSSIFWAIISIGRYIRVYNNIDANRDEYDLQGAEDYVFAARQNLKVCVKDMFGSSFEETLYLFNTSIYQADDKLSISRCESCGSVHRIDDMTRVISDKGVEEKILCENCDSEYVDVECPHCGRNVKKSERINSYCIYCEPLNRYKNTTKRTNSQKYRSTYKEYSHTNSTTAPFSMDHRKEVETAMSILEIEGSLTRGEINSAYRDRAKEAHPDMDTGSEEEFKKVREAKKTLLEELNK